MMTFDTDTPKNCGIVEERDGIVIAFHEKVAHPPGKKANAAVYICEPEILEYLATLHQSTIDLSTQVIPNFLGKIWTFHNDIYHRDIGTPESLALAQKEFVLP